MEALLTLPTSDKLSFAAIVISILSLVLTRYWNNKYRKQDRLSPFYRKVWRETNRYRALTPEELDLDMLEDLLDQATELGATKVEDALFWMWHHALLYDQLTTKKKREEAAEKYKDAAYDVYFLAHKENRKITQPFHKWIRDEWRFTIHPPFISRIKPW